MSTNENVIKVRKFSNPLKVARANVRRCESFYKDAIKTGTNLAECYQNYQDAIRNYRILRG